MKLSKCAKGKERSKCAKGKEKSKCAKGKERSKSAKGKYICNGNLHYLQLKLVQWLSNYETTTKRQ